MFILLSLLSLLLSSGIVLLSLALNIFGGLLLLLLLLLFLLLFLLLILLFSLISLMLSGYMEMESESFLRIVSNSIRSLSLFPSLIVNFFFCFLFFILFLTFSPFCQERI